MLDTQIAKPLEPYQPLIDPGYRHQRLFTLYRLNSATEFIKLAVRDYARCMVLDGVKDPDIVPKLADQIITHSARWGTYPVHTQHDLPLDELPRSAPDQPVQYSTYDPAANRTPKWIITQFGNLEHGSVEYWLLPNPLFLATLCNTYERALRTRAVRFTSYQGPYIGSLLDGDALQPRLRWRYTDTTRPCTNDSADADFEGAVQWIRTTLNNLRGVRYWPRSGEVLLTCNHTQLCGWRARPELQASDVIVRQCGLLGGQAH